jgi:hypothetical protein
MASRRDDFLAFSTVLTGCATDVLDAADSAAGYLGIVDANAPPGSVDALLRIYAEQLATGNSPKEAMRAILAAAFDDRWQAWKLSKGTRSILKLWFIGLWIYDTDPKSYPNAQAYARGLVWLAAQAHPVGVSNLGFGHWTEPPPQLSEFVGEAP